MPGSPFVRSEFQDVLEHTKAYGCPDCYVSWHGSPECWVCGRSTDLITAGQIWSRSGVPYPRGVQYNARW